MNANGEHKTASLKIARFLSGMIRTGINPDIWTIGGAVGTEPELKELPSGTTVVNFRIAHNKYRGKNKNSEERWFSASAFGDTAKEFDANVSKGDIVILLGEWDEPTWTNSDGEKRSKTVQTFHTFWIYKKKDGSAIPSEYAWPYDDIKASIEAVMSDNTESEEEPPASAPAPAPAVAESMPEQPSAPSAPPAPPAPPAEPVQQKMAAPASVDPEKSSEQLKGERVYLTTKLGRLLEALGRQKDVEIGKIEDKYQCSLEYIPMETLKELVAATEAAVKRRASRDYKAAA